MSDKNLKQLAYNDECEFARRIAAADDCDEAADIMADAIVWCEEHDIHVLWYDLELQYHNSFGPTCTVDDVIERMTIVHWRTVCQLVVRRIFMRAGLRARQMYGDKYPEVTLLPEDDSPVIKTVMLRLRLPPHTADGIRQAMVNIVNQKQTERR